jgi:hypothetical protein
VYLPDALDKLAAIYLAASDHAAVTLASDHLDVMLKTNPLAGVNHGSQYSLRVDPLEVRYTYSPLDRLVTVIDIDRV